MTERRPPGVPAKGRRLHDGGGGGKCVCAGSAIPNGAVPFPETVPILERGPVGFKMSHHSDSVRFSSRRLPISPGGTPDNLIRCPGEHPRNPDRGARPRGGPANTRCPISDCRRSLFIFMGSASFFDYQRRLAEGNGRSNFQTPFGIQKIPTDPHIRSMLDGVRSTNATTRKAEAKARPPSRPESISATNLERETPRVSAIRSSTVQNSGSSAIEVR